VHLKDRAVVLKYDYFETLVGTRPVVRPIGINSPTIISSPTEDQDQAMDTEYESPPTPYIRHLDPASPLHEKMVTTPPTPAKNISQSAEMSVSPITTPVAQDQHMEEDSRKSVAEKENLNIPKSPTTPPQRPQRTMTSSNTTPNQTKPKAAAASGTSGTHGSDSSSQGLLDRILFESVCENLLRYPNANAENNVGIPWYCDYAGAFMESQEPGSHMYVRDKLVQTLSFMKKSTTYTPTIRNQFAMQNDLLSDFLLSFFHECLSLPFTKATANGQVLAVEDVLPNIEHYIKGNRLFHIIIISVQNGIQKSHICIGLIRTGAGWNPRTPYPGL
jgi:hypothetical protein